MTLPGELERALWGRMQGRFTGKLTLHFREGRILEFEEAKITRLTGETDLSRQPSSADETAGETDLSRPANAGWPSRGRPHR